MHCNAADSELEVSQPLKTLLQKMQWLGKANSSIDLYSLQRPVHISLACLDCRVMNMRTGKW